MTKTKQIAIYSDEHAILIWEKLKRGKDSIADTLKEILQEWKKNE